MKKLLFFSLLLLFSFQNLLFAQKDRVEFSKRWKKKFSKQKVEKLQVGNFYEVEARFSKILTTEQKQALKKLGVQLLDYRGNLKYRIGIPQNLDNQLLDRFGIAEVEVLEAKNKINIPHPSPPLLGGRQYSLPTGEGWGGVSVEIPLSQNANPKEFIKKLEKIGISKIELQEYFNIVSAEIPANKITELAELPEVLSISQMPENQPHNHWGNTQSRGSNLFLGHRKLDGSGVRIAHFDRFNPFSHLDFAPRTINGEIIAGTDNNHATGNLGIMGGTGAVDPYARGVAPKTEFFSYHFSGVPSKMLSAIHDYGVNLTNNPYGPGVICLKPYSLTNHLEDRVAYDFPNVTHVFSVGNSQGSCGSWNNAENIAKNTIIVGGSNVGNGLTGSGGGSSVGTSQDGRLIPHILALGANVYQPAINNAYWTSGLGTSQACPQITGVTAQLLQRYRQLFGTDAPSALFKAVLCNTAQDIGNLYPDYRTGFGIVDALKAVRTLEENRFRINKIQTAQNQTLTIQVPQGATRLKVMIVWNDPPAAIGANPTLVNNLNLKVTHTSSGTMYNPWVLNPVSPATVATRGIDNRNNIEQVTIDNPIGGTYQFDIQGFNVAMGTDQEYALVWEIEEPHLEMTYPNGGENLKSGGTHYLRFSYGGTISGSFILDYSPDNGTTWFPATTTPADLATWTVPSTLFSDQVRIRVQHNGISDISDEVFTVSPQTTITSVVAGNNQLTVNWSAVTGASSYKVYLYDREKETWNLVGNTITGTSHTVTNLQNGVTYWLTVRCQSAAGALGERAYAASGIPAGAGTTHDLQVLDIQNPTNWTFSNSRPSNEFITVQIRNNGTGAITAGTNISVSYQIDNQAVVNENFTTATINPSDIFTYRFTNSANLSTYKTYFVSASVSLATDFVSVNNTFSKRLINKPLLKIIAKKTNPCGTQLQAELSDNTYQQTYSITNIGLALEDMSAATTVSVPDNTISNELPINFKFNFFGKVYDKFQISNDGFILFDADGTQNYSSWNPQTLPNREFPNNLIALNWTDLDPGAGGTIKYQTFGTAPNRKLVVEFNAVRYYASASTTTGQIILYETTNIIELHGQNIQTVGMGNPQTQGIENHLGTQSFVIAGRNRSSWTAADAYRFTPDPITYLWNTAETTSFITAAASGSYSVTYTQGSTVFTAFATVTNACGTPPTITQVFPADNSVNVSVSSTLEITFDKNIQADLGFITLSSASQTFFISAGDREKVQIRENKVLIKPPTWLNGNQPYFVKINSNAFKDFEGVPNFLAGITNTTTWNFDTENQTPYDIQLISKTLAENSPVGTLVGNLKTFDNDLQQTHTYTISGGTGAGTFTIVGNEIRTNGTLNYATNPHYQLEITSTDNGTPAKNVKKLFVISVHQFVLPQTSPKSMVLCSAGSTTLQAQSTGAGTWRFVTAFSEIPTLPTFTSINNPTTQVSNLQANTSYLFEFRLNALINNRFSDPNATVMITVLNNAPVTPSTEKNWVGTQSNVWYDCRNWADQNPPFTTSNIHIANSAVNQPLLYSPFYCQNLFISAGQTLDIQPFTTVNVLNNTEINGTLRVQPNAHIFVTGNLTNNSTLDLRGNLYLLANFLNNSPLNLSNGNFHFVSSTASQVLGTTQANLFNVILNKPNSLLTLSQKLGVNGNLQFLTGKIQSSTTNFLIFQDNATHSLSNDYSFVEGKVQKIGNDPFVFPIGKNNRFAPIELVALNNTDLADHFTAEYFDTGFGTLNPRESTVYEVKNTEYWQLDRGGVANTTQAQVRLFWKNHSGLAFGTAADLAVGRWNGTTWAGEGQGSITGLLNGSGSVSSASFVTAFSPFTFVFQTVILPPTPAFPPFTTITEPFNFITDLGIVGLYSPTENACNQALTKNETLKIRLKNWGHVGIEAGKTIQITYLEGSTAHTENWTLPSFWQSFEERDFTFSKTFDFSQRRNYTFTVKLHYLPDQIPLNNEIRREIRILPPFQILSSKPTLGCNETVELRAVGFPEGSNLVWEQNGKIIGNINFLTTTNVNALYSVRYEKGNCTEKTIFDLKETCAPVLQKVVYDNVKNTITLTFSEPIQKGQGAIRLTNGTEEILINLNDLQLDNQAITIILPKELQPNSEYKIGFEPTNFTDLAGNVLDTNTLGKNWTFPSNQSPKALLFCPKVFGKDLKIGLTLIDDFAPNPTFQILSSTIPNLRIENGEIVGNAGTAERLEIEVEGRDKGVPSLAIREKLVLYLPDYQALSAGADQVICSAGITVLQADTRQNLGRGEWVLAKISPSTSVLPKIENRFSAITKVLDLQANTNYEFVWKNLNFTTLCGTSDQEMVKITVLNQEQVADNQTLHWIGKQNYSWFDCRNWEERQIPDPTKNVVVKSDLPYPISASETLLSCENLTILENQSLLLDESVLRINGNFENRGYCFSPPNGQGGTVEIGGNLEQNGFLAQRNLLFWGEKNSRITGKKGVETENLTVWKTGKNLDLETFATVTGSLVLEKGKLQITENQSVAILEKGKIAFSNENFVIGKMTKVGKNNFVFPIGIGERLLKLEVSDLENATEKTQIKVSFVAQKPENEAFSDPITKISLKGFWRVECSDPKVRGTVRAFWDKNLTDSVEVEPEKLVLIRLENKTWEKVEGKTHLTASFSVGSVSENYKNQNPVSSLENELLEKNSFRIVPNPLEGNEIGIWLYAPVNQEITIEIFDILGRKIENFEAKIQAGENRLRLVPKQELGKGIYQVLIKNWGSVQKIWR